MAVNYDVYGRPEQWVDCYYQQTALTDKNKKAWFGGTTNQTQLRGAVNQNKLSYNNPVDKSIVFCGIGSESALSHISYIGKDPDNPIRAKVLETQDFDVSNYAFFEKTNQYGTQTTDAITYFRTDHLNRVAWVSDIDTDWNIAPYLEPYTSINPHNIALSIRVICGANNVGSNVQNLVLKEYMTRHNEFPFVFSVYGSPCFGVSGNRSFNAGKGTAPSGCKYLSIQLLDNMTIPSKNIDNQCFFWTEPIYYMGFSQNRTPSIILSNDVIYTFRTTAEGKNHIVINGENVAIEYYDNLIEDILKTAACFGLYFTTDENNLPSMSNTSDDMYIGILDENGIGHGQYLKGADTVRAPQAANDFKDMFSLGYDPQSQYIDYDSTPHYGTASYESINKMYALTGTQVLQIMAELSNAMSAIPSGMEETDYSTGTFLTNNPIDCIVSLRKYPVYNTAKNTSESYPVMFGGYESQISAPYAKNVQVFRFDFTGSKAFTDVFNNSFLDRETYTTAELYIPFCGTVKLSCDEFINHAIGVRLVLDYRTGSALAYIERDDIPLMSVGGDMGLDIPLTGVQTQTLANTIRRNAANLKQAQISAVQAASGGATMSGGDNPLQLVGGMINIANRIGNVNKALLSNEVASYSLHHTEIPFKSISTGDAVTGMSGEWCCRLSITRPVLSPDFDPETYGKTIGYACLKQGKVSDFTGLTVGTIDLTGINAPAEVKTMIQAAFKQGVYL